MSKDFAEILFKIGVIVIIIGIIIAAIAGILWGYGISGNLGQILFTGIIIGVVGLAIFLISLAIS